MISARGNPVCERSGSTRLAADAMPLSLIFSRPMRSTSSIFSLSRSYAMVTWWSTAPAPSRFCAAPPILPAGLAMSLSGWYVASMPSERRPCSTQSSRNA